MIPKIIHYCWFGPNALSILNNKCIDSWRRYYPDYEIMLWNETNSPIDHPYLKKALLEKKYAFAADFCRFYALYNYGGLYLDTDMECIQALDEEILCNDFVSAYEDLMNRYVSCGFIGAKKNSQICLEMINYYCDASFYENIPLILTRVLKDTDESFVTYPSHYFYPYNPYDIDQPIKQLMYFQIKADTYAIHHWEKSWNLSLLDKLRKKYFKLFRRSK